METEPKRHKVEECGQNFHLDALFTRNVLSSFSPPIRHHNMNLGLFIHNFMFIRKYNNNFTT